MGSINVNSLNVSTLGGRQCKTLLKIEGITIFKKEVLMLCDVRLGKHEAEISRFFALNRNCSYKTYWNSDREVRGVGIAIKRNIAQQIIDIYRSEDQNII